MCKQSPFQNHGVGGKVNQLGYVAPHVYMGEFQEMGFRILAGSICILRNISINSCKSNKQQFRIHSQSLLKNLGGGQDKPAGIGCPPPVIQNIFID